jgi:hypothetical protein
MENKNEIKDTLIPDNQLVRSKRKSIVIKTIKLIGFIFLCSTVVASTLLWGTEKISEWSISLTNSTRAVYSDLTNKKAIENELLEKQKEMTRLTNLLSMYTPKAPFLVVNSTENSFTLFVNRKVVKEGKCSTGSSIELENEEGKKWWFKTPKGVFRIHGKITSPVWIKPDWAFVEEGLPVPAKNHPSRYEYGVLGDYALAIGDGYFIHGTLYKRQLGEPVTHGCIRLNDDDLALVYKTLPVGAKVYIY